MALKVSDAAVKQVKELKQAQNLGDDVFLRMGVKGGGRSSARCPIFGTSISR